MDLRANSIIFFLQTPNLSTAFLRYELNAPFHIDSHPFWVFMQTESSAMLAKE